jgi:hypothetical protein
MYIECTYVEGEERLHTGSKECVYINRTAAARTDQAVTDKQGVFFSPNLRISPRKKRKECNKIKNKEDKEKEL